MAAKGNKKHGKTAKETGPARPIRKNDPFWEQATAPALPAHMENKSSWPGPPVAGIGASAGGLEAFKKFFAAMPADSGIAFVLIPHLDPKHESLMVELLARQHGACRSSRLPRACPSRPTMSTSFRPTST